MHILIKIGVAGLSLALLLSAYAGYRLIFSGGEARAVGFALCATAFAYGMISLLFRTVGTEQNVHTFVGMTGVTLAALSWLWASDVPELIGLRANGAQLMRIATGVALITMLAPFSRSGFAEDIHALPTGIVRYKLTSSGNLLFAISLLLLFAAAVVALIRYRTTSALQNSSQILMLLSVFAVVFPWKEVGLNAILAICAVALRIIATTQQR
ncbi:MAG: hypothetical protein U1F16_17830 [Turneriella sp.]